MESITFNQLVGTVGVILILCGAYVSIMTAVKTVREERRRRDEPVAEIRTKMNEYEEYFRADKRRIERLEDSAKANEKEMQLLLKSMLALLRHGIDGNNIDGLKACQKEVQEFLVEK